MYLKTHLALFVAAILTTTTAQSTQEPVRFSRLLSKQPDILRFSSISNLGPSSPVFRSLQTTPEAPVVIVPTTKKAVLGHKQFLHRAAVNHDDGAVLITRAQPGEEYVFIQSNIKSDDVPKESSITSINQKPSSRKPLALLRQSSGNKLNISPVFPDSPTANEPAPVKSNGNDQVSILSANANQDDEINEATTATPQYDEYYEDGTTENSQQYDDVPATTTPPLAQQKKEGRMIVNVVTSAPRVVFHNNSTTPLPVISSTALPVVKPSAKSVEENLVVDAFHRSGHFPDFEDSPAHLHVAESNQPARVNVRPASSGKDYEYEYIYYYYDDEDDDNSTSKKADSSAAVDASSQGVDLAQAAPVQNSFESDKISVSNLPTNSLDTADSRSPKAYLPEPVAASIPETPEISDEQLQVTTLPTEVLRTHRPNSVNRPVILKQSNLAPTAPAELPIPTTERRIPERRTTTTTTAAPTTESARSRLRNKSRLDAPSVNQFNRVTEEPVVTEAPIRRPIQKDLLRRRNPARRPSTEAPVEEQHSEQAAPVPVEQKPVRLPTRPRFPPRQSSIAPAVVEQEQEAAPAPVQEQAQSYETQQPVSHEADKKAKDNFARQKSINDLYALTRLHQLAINTRVPNRKPDQHSKAIPPKVAGGFVNSAEQTTRYPEDSNEATTISSLHPSGEQVELTVQPTTTTTTTTTTEASLPERPAGLGRRNRPFRPRGQRLNPAPVTEDTVSTTEASSANRVPSSPNRFGTRRRFSSTTAAPQVENSDGTTESRPAPRAPARNRFSGRTRPTTSTTESSDAQAAEQQRESEAQPQRRRPGFQRRRQQQSSTAQSADEEPATPASTTAAQPRRTSGDSERRRFNFGNPARNRPSGPGSRPLIRGRASTTEAPTDAAPEAQEPIVSEQVSVSEGEVHEAKAAPSDKEPIVSVSSTTTSSVSSDVVVSKPGSAGVLGRLRNRSKPIITTTTAAPEVHSSERKPSRLNGILNRRKLGGSTTAAPAVEEEIHEEHEEPQQSQHSPNEAAPPQGVVVQISSTVTESEEIGHPEDHSSTTHTSILNRLKSQRKPGQIYRKSSVSSSE